MLAKKLQAAAKAVEPVFIEDTFAVHLYTGNGSTQTITNGIDLAGKGGLVWIKNRSISESHLLKDTARGSLTLLSTDSTAAEIQNNYGVAYGGFNSNGFTAIGDTYNYASWTFRKQPKFFDVVTYTGNGATNIVSHSLGSVPAFVVAKRTDSTSDWFVAARTGNNLWATRGRLNTTAAFQFFNQDKTAAFTSTTINVDDITGFSSDTNVSGGTYVAYLFAHNAGGFGDDGLQNVVSCGSFNPALGFVDINLGYEPQWILFKRTDSTGNWRCYDTMRGWTADINSSTGANAQELSANLSAAEVARTDTVSVSTTGFRVKGLGSSGTYIYIAIRRGPMKVPTSGTSVFAPAIATWSGGAATYTTNFPVDLALSRGTRFVTDSAGFGVYDRLRGSTPYLKTAQADAEISGNSLFASMTTFTDLSGYSNGTSGVLEAFRRAPGFFDVVCYTGTGANATRAHNLSAVPQMMIVKKRSATSNWAVYHSALGAVGWILINSSAAASAGADFWQSTTPTAVNFYTGTNGNVGDSGQTYVAYLFATCPGVSKVGSYTGNGSSQTLNCGFTAGARFVLIKRTDSTGDWYVWDSARGIVSANDPRLSLNSTAAEVTTDDSIDPNSSGFIVNQVAATNINVNAATYIFLAIA